MSVQCRTCAEKIFNPNAKNLFERDDNEILKNIETLTGIRLIEDKDMPKYICTCCYLDLYHSIAFRERCIQTEQFLHNTRDKTTIIDPLNMVKVLTQSDTDTSDQLSLTEDTKLNEDTNNEIVSQHFEQSHTLNEPKTNVLITKKKKRKRKTRKQSRNFKSETQPLTLCQPTSCQDQEGSKSKPLPLQSIDSYGEKQNTSNDESKVIHASSVSPAPSVCTESPIKNLTSAHKDTTNIACKLEKSGAKPPSSSKVFICDLCGHQSSNPKNLDIHILRHKGEKNFECVECGTKHYSKYLLQLHIRVKHKGEKPFVCRYCGQSFYSGSTRQRHEQVRHIRSWAYECKICGKRYNTKSCLNKHEFLHSGLRPYRCDICNVAFPRKPGLRIHCRTKQHQKRANEALTSQIGIKDLITVPNDPDSFAEIIEDLDV